MINVDPIVPSVEVSGQTCITRSRCGHRYSPPWAARSHPDHVLLLKPQNYKHAEHLLLQQTSCDWCTDNTRQALFVAWALNGHIAGLTNLSSYLGIREHLLAPFPIGTQIGLSFLHLLKVSLIFWYFLSVGTGSL